MRPVVLCFSGLDPSGGAGLHADIEAVAALGGLAAVACTALTIQDSNTVFGFEAVSTELLLKQARAVLNDLPVGAIKLGMLGSPELVSTIATVLDENPHIPVVLDPVLAANAGGNLAMDGLIQAICSLFSRATVITPNSVEARRLSGEEDLEKAVDALRAMGTKHVFLKGGHEPGTTIINRLYSQTDLLLTNKWPRLPGEYHGSGCTQASAIAAGLAAGLSLPEAIAQAEEYVFAALKAADRPRQEGQFIPRRVMNAGE